MITLNRPTAKNAANKELAQGLSAASMIVVSQAQDCTLDEAAQKQGEYLDPIFSSEDAIEGATAFAEKRAPEWKGQ